jgi:hypothetical protein
VRIGCAALVLLVVVAITVTIAIPVIRGRQRRQAVQRLEQAGGAVIYAHQSTDAPPRSAWSTFAAQVLGMDVGPVVYIGAPERGWTDNHVRLLRYFPEVEGITLGPSELSGPLLEALRELKNLRWLSLQAQAATSKSMAHLKYFPALESVSICADLDDDAWQSLAGLKQLTTLALTNCKASAPAPAWFRSAGSRIEQVNLLGDGDNGPILSELRGWQSIRTLRMHRVTLDDAAVQSVNSLPELELLELYFSQVPAGFSPAALTGQALQNVELSRCEVQRDAHSRCSSWKGQPKIDLSYSTVVD